MLALKRNAFLCNSHQSLVRQFSNSVVLNDVHVNIAKPFRAISQFSKDDVTIAKPFSAIPGPKPIPFLGNIRDLAANKHRYSFYCDDCFQEYGDIFKLNFFGTNTVVIKNPDTLEAILRAEGKHPVRELNGMDRIVWLYKNKAKQDPPFVWDKGERWKRLRSGVGKHALPRNVLMYSTAFNSIFKRLIGHIKEVRGEHGVIEDVTLPIKHTFTETSAKFSFGTDMTAITDSTDKYKEYFESISTIMEMFYRLNSELPFYKLYNNQLSKDFMRAMKVTQQVAGVEIDKMFSRLESGEQSEAPGLLEHYLRDGKLTEEESITEASTMFFSGVDTTSNSILFLLHALAKHPEVQEKLHSEIQSVLGDHKQPATPEQISQMPYLKFCFLEMFRLWSTIPFFSRVIDQDAVLLGYKVPANTSVMFSLYSAGRDEVLFPNPTKFDPERWRRDETHAFALQPFGFGPRACYGRRIAELEMRLLIIQIVSNFKISVSDPNLKIMTKVIAKPSEAVAIKFEDRI